MEKIGFNHQNVWDEAFTRTRESLQGLRDYVKGVRSGKIAADDPEQEWYREFGLLAHYNKDIDAALEAASLMISALETELHKTTPEQARDGIIKVMRDNLDAYLFTGAPHASYKICNDMVEALAGHYQAVCEERSVPAYAFLMQRIFTPAHQYAEISTNTVDAMADRVKMIMRSEGIQEDGIVTPYEFASYRVMLGKHRADNDDHPTFEDDIAIQNTARSVMGCTVDAFHPVPFEKMCPEMVLMIETLGEYRAHHNVPYREFKDLENISSTVSRDFAKIYRACPEMADNTMQLLEALGRTQQAIGQAGKQMSRE